jgi:hypothetical protein
MSWVVAAPDALVAASESLAALESTLSAATAAAAAPTTAVVAAAEDDVSTGIAALFREFGEGYQAVCAQALAFHRQFAGLLGAGAGSYIETELANAQQVVASIAAPANRFLSAAPIRTGTGVAASVSTGPAHTSLQDAIVGPYHNLLTNSTANLRAIVDNAGPDLVKALSTGSEASQQALTAMESGNPLPVLNIVDHLAQGYTGLIEDLSTPVPVSMIRDLSAPVPVSITSLSPTTITVALGPDLPQVLAFDALGAPINAANALITSGAAVVGALQTGDPMGAAIALIDAPANIANAFLNGQQTLSLALPVGGASITGSMSLGGLLAPLTPTSLTATTPGSPILKSIALTAPPTGGAVTALVDYAPEAALMELGL